MQCDIMPAHQLLCGCVHSCLLGCVLHVDGVSLCVCEGVSAWVFGGGSCQTMVSFT